MLGVIIASKYSVLILLGNIVASWARIGWLGGAYTAAIIKACVFVGIFTAVTSNATNCGRFTSL
jgi:hypothetical protein